MRDFGGLLEVLVYVWVSLWDSSVLVSRFRLRLVGCACCCWVSEEDASGSSERSC
jgi:hypothetical protein